MASKYALTGNWTADTSWSTTDGGANDTTKPTAADDVFFTSNTGDMTIDSGAVARSWNCTGYTNTATHTAGVTLTLGDATAGASNIILKLVSGMTYTLGSASTSSISFSTTSSTQQTITFGTKTVGGLTFVGSTSDLVLVDAITSAATVTFTSGTLHWDGAADNSGLTHTIGGYSHATGIGTRTFGTATIIVATGGFTVSTIGGTQTSSSATFELQGANVTFTGNAFTYGTVKFTGSGTATLNNTAGNTVVNNLTRTGTAAKTDAMVFEGNKTFTGALTLNGNSATNRLFVRSNAFSSPRTLTANGTLTVSNADFRDITGAGSASWDLSAITGGAGDSLGNSGITFTTAQTNYWVGGTGSWSDVNKWASSSGGSAASGRVPLCQDSVRFDANSFSAGSQTVTADMPRIGADINWTGVTNSPTYAQSVATTAFGSLTLVSGMSFSNSNGTTYEGRSGSNYTLTSAGKSHSSILTIFLLGGTFQFGDAFSSSGAGITHTHGTVLDNGYTLSFLGWTSNNSNTRSVTATGTWNISGSGSRWTMTTTTGLTWSHTGTINMNNASSGTFAGGGQIYNIVDFRTASIVNTITGANTFGRLMASNGATTITFPGSTTTTILSGQGLGNGTNVITFTASAGSATVAKSGGGTVGWDYVHLTNIIASTANTWYAGTHSTDNGGNTNWIFTAVPSDYYSGSINDFKQAWYSSRGYTRTLNDNELAYFNTENSTTFISIRDAKSRFFLNLGYSGTLGDMYYKSLLTTLGLSASSFSVTDAERIFYSNTSNEFV